MKKTTALTLFASAFLFANSTLAADCDPATQLCWIKAVNADNSLTAFGGDATSYANDLYQLMPNLEFIGLRSKAQSSTGGMTNEQMIALVTAIRAKFPTATISFNPDTSTTSYDEWGCSPNPKPSCLAKNTITALNTLNAALINKNVRGFDAYTIEQSSLIPVALPNKDNHGVNQLQNIKACFQENGGTCLGGQTANHNTTGKPIQFGYVGPSCGAPNTYGANGFDVNMPQFYNLFHHTTFGSEQPTAPLTEGDTGPLTKGTPYMIIDGAITTDAVVNLKAKPPIANYYSLLPANITGTGDNQTVYQKSDPQYAANYLAWILINKYGKSASPFPCEGITSDLATLYIGLSGEPEFLGGSGWSVEKLNAFHKALIQNLTDAEIVKGSIMKFGIWNFKAILKNNTTK